MCPAWKFDAFACGSATQAELVAAEVLAYRGHRRVCRLQGAVDVRFGVGRGQEHVVLRMQPGPAAQGFDGEQPALLDLRVVGEQYRGHLHRAGLLQHLAVRAGLGREPVAEALADAFDVADRVVALEDLQLIADGAWLVWARDERPSLTACV